MSVTREEMREARRSDRETEAFKAISKVLDTLPRDLSLDEHLRALRWMISIAIRLRDRRGLVVAPDLNRPWARRAARATAMLLGSEPRPPGVPS